MGRVSSLGLKLWHLLLSLGVTPDALRPCEVMVGGGHHQTYRRGWTTDPSAAEGVFTQSLWGQNVLWDSLHPGWEALGQLPLTRLKCLYRLLLFINTGAGNGNPLSILAGKVLWTERPGGLQSTGSQSRTQLWDWAIFIALPVSPVLIHIIYKKDLRATSDQTGLTQFKTDPLACWILWRS